MILTEKEAKLWSRMGPRAVFGLNVAEVAKVYSDLIVMSADVRSSAGLEPFYRTYPDRYIDVGIAEQNMIGIAAGLASEGYPVITTTFAPFETMRCCEQIRVNLGYMKHKVIMAGLGSGLVLGVQGFTHCCVEDVGVLRSIPNLTIISPADAGEVAKALWAAMEWKESVYLRLCGGPRIPIIYREDYDFQIGKAIPLRDGADIGIIAAGTSVAASLKAAEILEESGLSSSVINMHTIKPLDSRAVQELASKVKLLVTIEEHNIIGGLGGAVAEEISSYRTSPPLLRIGIPDQFCKPGSYDFLLETYGLTPQQIAVKIKEKFAEIQ